MVLGGRLGARWFGASSKCRNWPPLLFEEGFLGGVRGRTMGLEIVHSAFLLLLSSFQYFVHKLSEVTPIQFC